MFIFLWVRALATNKKDYKKGLDIAHKRWEAEIGLLWRRTLIFWGITLAGFTAYTYSFDKSEIYALLIANFGFISSFVWTLANRGGKFWQDSWDQHVKRLESKVLGYELSHKPIEPPKKKKKGFWRGVRFSPSRLITALSDYVTVVWYLILIIQLVIIGLSNTPLIILLASIATALTIIYAFLVYRSTKWHPD